MTTRLRQESLRVPSMTAAVLERPGEVALRRVARPEPGPRQVRIRVEGSGVCASNLAVWQGMPWFEYPLAPGAPGHEAWGVVDAVGSEVGSISPGQRVAALSGNAYAEFDVAEESAVVPLPSALDGRYFPGEPLGCAINIFRRSRIEPGHTVAIVGAGFLGTLLTRLVVNAGARVLAISRRPVALEFARSFGASETIAMDDHWKIIEQVRELTEGVFCDVVIEAVGKQWPLDLAAELTRERGTLVIAGYHQDGPRQVSMQLWNWRGLDVINAHERDPAIYIDGIREAVRAVASGVIDPGPLLTHTYGLDRLAQALNDTRDRPDGFLKAIVIP